MTLVQLTLVVVKAVIVQIKNSTIRSNREAMYIVSNLHSFLAIVNLQSSVVLLIVPISEVEDFIKFGINLYTVTINVIVNLVFVDIQLALLFE